MWNKKLSKYEVYLKLNQAIFAKYFQLNKENGEKIKINICFNSILLIFTNLIILSLTNFEFFIFIKLFNAKN